jgi:P-type E1-E2 ATPase
MPGALRKKNTPRSPGATISSAESTTSPNSSSEPPVPFPGIPLAVAAAGGLVGAFATTATLIGIASVLLAASAAFAVVGPAKVRRDAGGLAVGIGPAAVGLSMLASWASHVEHGDARLFLASTALVAACVIVRGWLDTTAWRPLERIIGALRTRMPTRARMPVDDAARSPRVEAREVEADRLRAGEEVIVTEGEIVPVDGVVRAGDADVIPHPAARTAVRRRASDPVIAGAKVTEGAIRVLVTRVGEDRALLRPARFGDGTADDAAAITRLVARAIPFAGFAVMFLGVLGLWLGHGGGGWSMRLSAAAGALVAIPILALRRAVEMPFVAAGATAAERGVVFRSARAMDRAGRVSVVVLCTHGTITEGAPEVVEAYAPSNGTADDAIAAAASAEAAVHDHPIARAIVRYAEQRGLPAIPVCRVLAVAGRGVTAVGNRGEAIVVGNRQLLLAQGLSVASLDAEAEQAEKRGLSVVFIGIDRRARAFVALRDEERPGARAAIQRLIDLGIEVLLLSGDHRGTVEALARRVDVDHVRAELTPEERGAEVRRLREGGSVVATIGRAGRDEEALAAADVPIVLGAAGSPEGERAVALTSDDVRDAAAALWLAHAARREATRSAAVAAFGGAVLVALAAIGSIGPGLVALGATVIDAYALFAGPRLLRRIRLRLPARG